MNPRITDATVAVQFDLSEDYEAVLLVEVKSAGVIQYHHVLTVMDEIGQPVVHYAAEWSALDPSYKDQPMFGTFDYAGHSSDDNVPSCLDPSLFLLRAVELARERLCISVGELNEGEIWALTRILKALGASDRPAECERFVPGYTAALAKNDARMATFLERVSR